MKKRDKILRIVVRTLIPGLTCLAVLVSCLIGTKAKPSGENDPPAEVRISVMSQDLLEGIPVGANAEQVHVQGDFRAVEGSGGEGVYQELFRLDTSAADSIAPASELEKIGIVPVGQTPCNLPDGTVGQCSFGLAQIEFMGEMKEGRVIFGPEGVEPSLGLSALEGIGFALDPATQTLKRISPTE